MKLKKLYNVLWVGKVYATSYVYANNKKEAKKKTLDGLSEGFEPDYDKPDWELDSVEEEE